MADIRNARRSLEAAKRNQETIGTRLTELENYILAIERENLDLKRNNEAIPGIYKEIASLKQENVNLRGDISARDIQIKDLQAQLAEKDEKVKHFKGVLQTYILEASNHEQSDPSIGSSEMFEGEIVTKEHLSSSSSRPEAKNTVGQSARKSIGELALEGILRVEGLRTKINPTVASNGSSETPHLSEHGTASPVEQSKYADACQKNEPAENDASTSSYSFRKRRSQLELDEATPSKKSRTASFEVERTRRTPKVVNAFYEPPCECCKMKSIPCQQEEGGGSCFHCVVHKTRCRYARR